MSNRLELPNPGSKRFWEIRTDRDGDFILALKGQFGHEIATTLIYGNTAIDAVFIHEANELIKSSAAQVQYTGTYKFEEN